MQVFAELIEAATALARWIRSPLQVFERACEAIQHASRPRSGTRPAFQEGES
jgi:hypothetical protein